MHLSPCGPGLTVGPVLYCPKSPCLSTHTLWEGCLSYCSCGNVVYDAVCVGPFGALPIPHLFCCRVPEESKLLHPLELDCRAQREACPPPLHLPQQCGKVEGEDGGDHARAHTHPKGKLLCNINTCFHVKCMHGMDVVEGCFYGSVYCTALHGQVLSWCIGTAEMLDAHDIRSTIITSEEVDGYIQDVNSWSTVPAVSDEELAKLEQSAEVCILPYVQESAFFALNRTKELQERVRMHKEGLAEMLRNMAPHEKVGDPANQELIEGTKEVASALQGVLSSAAAQQDEGAESSTATLTVSPQPGQEGLMGTVVLTPSHEVDKALEDLEIAVLRLQEDHSDWVVESEGAAAEVPPSPSSQDDFTDSGRFDSPGKPMIQLVSGMR